MHSRALLPFESALVEGMTGEIRNKVTLHRGNSGDLERHFPRIEEVRDSFGNAVTPYAGDSMGGATDSGLTLHPGEVIKFECTAWDPDGLEPTWTMDPFQTYDDIPPQTATGLHVTFERKIVPHDIGASLYVRFRLLSPRAHHRFNSDDGTASILYRVLPGEPESML